MIKGGTDMWFRICKICVKYVGTWTKMIQIVIQILRGVNRLLKNSADILNYTFSTAFQACCSNYQLLTCLYLYTVLECEILLYLKIKGHLTRYADLKGYNFLISHFILSFPQIWILRRNSNCKELSFDIVYCSNFITFTK